MEKIIEKLSKELNLPKLAILNTYKAYWKFIKCTIEQIDFDLIKSESDYKEARINFNIPNIGKLGCSYDRMIRIKNQNKYRDEAKYKKDLTNV